MNDFQPKVLAVVVESELSRTDKDVTLYPYCIWGYSATR